MSAPTSLSAFSRCGPPLESSAQPCPGTRAPDFPIMRPFSTSAHRPNETRLRVSMCSLWKPVKTRSVSLSDAVRASVEREKFDHQRGSTCNYKPVRDGREKFDYMYIHQRGSTCNYKPVRDGRVRKRTSSFTRRGACRYLLERQGSGIPVPFGCLFAVTIGLAQASCLAPTFGAAS